MGVATEDTLPTSRINPVILLLVHYSVFRVLQIPGSRFMYLCICHSVYLYVCNSDFLKVAQSQVLPTAVQAQRDNILNLIVFDF